MALGKFLCACVFVVLLTGGEAWWVSRRAPSHPKYKVSVKVANEWGAGTDADVYVRLYGVYRQCYKGLDKSWHNDFERNSYETYDLDCGSDLGKLSRVRIGHTRGGWWGDWKVSYVNVHDPRRGTTRYDANFWLRGESAHGDLYTKVHGGWSHWTGWSSCDRSCGFGHTYRTRACNSPAPDHGGNQCYGSSREVRSCYLRACPVNGGWSGWGNYGTCTASCGGGTQTRKRACNNPPQAHGGLSCSGPASDTRRCNEQPCPVYGRWTTWSGYTVCIASCGGGTQARTRTCTNPAPAHGGMDCEGPTKQTQSCGNDPCPIDGVWSDWIIGECSASCGGGALTKTRTCTNPAPAHGGMDCEGPTQQTQSCGNDPCPIDGVWSDWIIGECSASCGGGALTKTRTCTNPAPAHGGMDCEGPTQQTQSCGNDPCPIDGVWSDWIIGECSASCGGGALTKTRTCTNPAPAYGGKECQGSETENESCGNVPCPINGGWSDWVPGECSVSCGGGTQTNTRACNKPAPQYGGRDCEGPAIQSRPCNNRPCQIDDNNCEDRNPECQRFQSRGFCQSKENMMRENCPKTCGFC